MNLLKLLSAGSIATMVAAAGSLYAQVQVPAGASLIDDCEGGTNQNKFGSYWYFYDDTKNLGNSSIDGTSPGPLGLLGCAPVLAEGNTGSAGYKMSYKMGTTKCPIPGVPTGGYNFVGTGTMLAPDGKVCNITGASKITYWAKATPAVKLNVEVAISDITDFNYHRVLTDVSASWTEYTIVLEEGIGIAQQPGWGEKKPFNKVNVQKIQWQVHSDQLGASYAGSTGVLNLDDVIIHDFAYVPADVCMGCLSMAMPAPNAILADLDAPPVNGNKAGGWWYCYNDAAGHSVTKPSDFSEISAGATPPEATEPLGTSPTIKIEGNGKTGNGAYIGFQLGPTFKTGTSTEIVKPFVGIGTSLSDKLATMFYNALKDGHKGVAFDYKLTGAPYLRLEVVSENDNSDKGVVWYRLFPKKDAWQTAVVPFDSLVLPQWGSVNPTDPALALKKDKLKKIQWAVQDAKGTQGTIAIDNVYFFGGASIAPIKVLYSAKSAKGLTGASANLMNRSLQVLLPVEGNHSGTISLVNIRGMTVAAKTVSSVSKVDMNLANVANGMYFCVVKTTGANGKAINASIPVTIY